MNRDFGRVITAMITPFDENGAVNYKAAGDLAEHLVNNGSDAILAAGTTGESPTLTETEKLRLFSTLLDRIGDRIPVIAGTGTNNTASSICFTKEAEKLGVHAALLVGPYYNKPPQEGYYRHFKAVAEETALPIFLYNIPGRTGSNILPETIARLAEIENIVALKEAAGSIEQVRKIISLVPKAFRVYSGDDEMTLPLMEAGGYGVVSVASHVVGTKIQDMIRTLLSGHSIAAHAMQKSLLPIFKAMFVTTNPIPVKTAVNLMGLRGGPFRLPLVPPTEAETAAIREALMRQGIL